MRRTVKTAISIEQPTGASSRYRPMIPSSETSVYRIRSFYRKGDTPKKYQRTYEVIDEAAQERMAVCDLIGQAVFSTLAIADHQGRIWEMKPNRKFMPSRWTLSNPDREIAIRFDQKILGKLANPIQRTMLSLQNPSGTEIYRLADARTGIADRILDLNLKDWVIFRGDTPAAKLGWLERPAEPARGLLGRIRKKLTSSDRAVISAGPAHVLPAPAALGMLLLFNELNHTSGG